MLFTNTKYSKIKSEIVGKRLSYSKKKQIGNCLTMYGTIVLQHAFQSDIGIGTYESTYSLDKRLHRKRNGKKGKRNGCLLGKEEIQYHGF
jgi:hypothetical protein